MHVVGLTPGHQIVSRKARIGTHDDAHIRPLSADVSNDALDFLHRAFRSVHAGRPQFGGQQMAPAEHVQRQIAVAVIITVEEPSFLVPVHRVIGRIEIEDDLVRRLPVRFHKQVDQKPLDGDRILANLVVARRLQPAQFHPVERRFPGHRRTIFALGFQLACQHRHHRIVAQFVVVVEVLVAKRDASHPLRHQRHDLMLDILLTASVTETRSKSGHQPDRTIGRAQQQRSRIRRDHTPVESRYDLASFNGSKSKQICATLCRHRGAPRIVESGCCTTTFVDSAPRCTHSVRYAG